MAERPETSFPQAAGVLGFAGALPFVALAGLSFYDNVNVSLQSIEILRLYGALILSFLGGIHWGLALGAAVPSLAASWRRYAVSVVPALWGWAAMLAPTYRGLIVLAVGFVLLLAYDIFAARGSEAPAWYPRLRLPLTAIVVSCLLLAAYRF